MIKIFKKGDEIRNFRIENGKVYTTIVLGNFRITNPTLEQFLSTGWEEYIEPEPEPYVPTKEELVERAIRNGLEEEEYSRHYSLNQEFQINRLMSNPNKTAEDIQKWEEYNSFVEKCIIWAESQLDN